MAISGHILVVEDNPVNAAKIEHQLTKLGYTLGGHLKTGHRRTLQNRPTERNQNKIIYTLREDARASIFVRLGLAGLY